MFQENRGLDRRPLIFIAVMILHGALMLLLLRAKTTDISSRIRDDEPLVMMLLPNRIPAAAPSVTAPPRPRATPRERGNATAKRQPQTDQPITLAPTTLPEPTIDWQREAELAAQSGVAGAERDNHYRDLSTLSAAQLNWVKQNGMTPQAPGIQWRHPRFEFDKNSGLPILWINDHCVLVMLIVFCGIGHIEANGDLFKHMRDPHDP